LRKDLTEVAKNIKIEVLPKKANSGRFISSFGGLSGYGANYYGYAWPRVFAKYMFSVFEKNATMDTKTGVRYKRAILEKGSSEEEMDMLRNFLGREPNSDAYMRSLGIK
jgi:thimet oligopeptidase